MFFSHIISSLTASVSALGAAATLFAVIQNVRAADHQYEMVASSAGSLQVEELASFNFPWGMDYLPDGRLLVTEKPGKLKIYDQTAKITSVSGLPEITYKGQGGLLDVAVHPDFSSNRLVYFFFVHAADDQPESPEVQADPRLGPYVDKTDTVLKGGVVARGKLMGSSLQNVEVIWRQNPYIVGLGHYGGRLLFADDGKLIITSGERQRFSPSQSKSSNLGKVLRINDDGSIPVDNPFAKKAAPLNAVWSMGHRNPLGVDIRPGTQELWVQEMGPLFGDELNKIESGKNYGWPEVSNGEHYDMQQIPHHETSKKYERPDFYWRPAISPSGLTFYDGAMFKDWQGDAFLGGLSSKSIVRVDFKDGVPQGDERIFLNRRVRDVMQAADGSIYALIDDETGALLRISIAEKSSASKTD